MYDEGTVNAARTLVDWYWEHLLKIEPILGTEVGDERFDDRLPDPSEAGLADRERLHRGALRTLEKVDRARLDLVTRTTLDVLEAIARRELESIEYRLDRFRAVTHLFGPGNLLAEIGSLQRADTPERLDRYLGRLETVPAYLDAVAHVAQDAAKVGQTAPVIVVDRSIGQVERLLALPFEESPALLPVAEATPDAKARVVELLRDAVVPAYARYLEALRLYRPAARETIGLAALPRGDAMYAAEVRAWTTLDRVPDAIHDLGREDLAGIQEERRGVAARLGHADAAAAIAAHQASGRNTARSRSEMVHRAQEQVYRGFEAARAAFGRLPSANCEVRPVEEFREGDMPFAFYQPPTADGSRPGVYYVNASGLEQRQMHRLASVTYHEANPGHHFQIAIEMEIPDRPALRRFGGLLAGSAFIEGWGLYAERLADEIGIYQDEYERLGMLDAQGWRAARLIVDTGIHALGWDRDRAVRQMIEAGVSSLDAEIEVDRYIAMPGQALAYKTGQFEIERWRREAKEREGASFSLPLFHDRLLALGSLPLPALQREIEKAQSRASS